MTTIETTGDIIVNAAQFLVNQLWWSVNRNKDVLEKLSKKYNYQHILLAAYSLATINKDNKNYKNYYNHLKSTIPIYTIIIYFNLQTLLNIEADVFV